MALAVVREKELGSITNLYVTPVTRIEFILGKQLPYIAVAMINLWNRLAISTRSVPGRYRPAQTATASSSSFADRSFGLKTHVPHAARS